MTPEQKAAYIQAQSVMLLGELMGMHAENQWRMSNGDAIAYREDAFQSVINASPCHHNAVIELFRD